MEINAGYHEQQEECIICLDTVEKEWRDLECHHRYHKKCIENWIVVRATCPLCMKNIKDNKVDDRNINSTREIDHISIRRFMLFVVIIVGVIIVTVLCSS